MNSYLYPLIAPCWVSLPTGTLVKAGGVLLTLEIVQIHSSEYRLNSVAFATAGFGQAASLAIVFALSTPLQIILKFMNSAPSWGGPHTAKPSRNNTPGSSSPTHSVSGPCAAGARRVFGNPKLRNGFPKTPVSVLLNVPFHCTTKQ